jgi:hypothetical protein
VGAVVGVVAIAEGVEIPVGVALGPEVDFDFLALAGGGELGGVVLGLVEGEVGEEGFFGELFADDQNVAVEAMMPVAGGEEGLEGFGQRLSFQSIDSEFVLDPGGRRESARR